MNKKQIMIPLLIMFLLPLAFVSVAKAETRIICDFSYEGLKLSIYAPYQAYPGDTITIRAVVEALLQHLRHLTIRVDLVASRSEGYDVWSLAHHFLNDEALAFGEIRDMDWNAVIGRSVSPGQIWCMLSCTWEAYLGGGVWHSHSRTNHFQVTYVKNKAYEDLQVAYNDLSNDYDTLLSDYNDLLNDYNNLQGDYDSLSSNYNTLEADHNSLESSYNSLQTSHNSLNSTYNDLKSEHDTIKGDLGTTKNLSYLFLITTIIFIATTVLFAIRKPK